MVSPQKHDEQRGARDHIQLARQPLASQAGDDPKPEDSATDAVASGDNSAALEAGSAARQDAFQESNAEAGGPASGNPFSDTIAPDPDEPRFAGAQADELTTKYFGNTEAQPRRVARLDLEAGPNADFHPGMPLAEDLSIKMREADRGEHALEELDDARARTSGASSAKAACDASAGDQNSVSFSLDPYESIKSVNLLLGHKPPGLKQPSKGNITSANTKMITIRVALKKWYEWAKYEMHLKSHLVLPSRLRQIKTQILPGHQGEGKQKAVGFESPMPTFDDTVAAAGLTKVFSFQNVEEQPPILLPAEQTPDREMLLRGMLTSKFEEATSLEPPAFASEKQAVPSFDPTKIFSLNLEDLPSDFSSHKDHASIQAILGSKTDHTLSRWRRRAVYTEENFDQWVEWSPVEKTHRDEFQCMNDLTKEKLLIAPALREPDTEAVADAWNMYRKHLIEEIQQALLLGCAWKRILTKLHLAFSDTERGYPRLKLAVDLALKDSKLMQFPLLHTDVFIYKLDESFALGSKYQDDAYTTKWMQTTYRLPGEDAISLATRVENAYLEWWDNLDEKSLYQLPENTHSHQIRKRYIECLRGDEADPIRSRLSAAKFQDGWGGAMNDVKIAEGKGTTVKPPTLESVVRQTVAIFEARYRPEGHKDGASWEATMFSGYTGQKQLQAIECRPPNHAERRKQNRLHLQPGYNAEPPPPAYND